MPKRRMDLAPGAGAPGSKRARTGKKKGKGGAPLTKEEKEELALKRGGINVAHVGNKVRRQQLYHESREELKRAREAARKKRQEEHKALGSKAPPKMVPRTLENTREFDETIVEDDDDEVAADEAQDEFASYFAGATTPKLLLTTCVKPSRKLLKFAQDFQCLFEAIEYRKRTNVPLKTIVELAKERDYTDLLVLTEDSRHLPNGLWLVHLPDGPTIHFKLTSATLRKEIIGHGNPTEHKPEVILNNFSTRLGHTIARSLACLYPQRPDFVGRRVVTFHNQRDFIFVRHHRYIFDEDGKRASLQELGPQFTLKLRSVQHGTFDTTAGEYIWAHRTEMDTSRRRFFL